MIKNINSKTSQWLAYFLVLLAPLSVYWQLGSPVFPTVLQMYVTPGLYLTDLIIIAILLVGLIRILRKRNIDINLSDPQILLFAIPLFILVILAFVSSSKAIFPALAVYTALRWLLSISLFVVLISLDLSVQQIIEVFIIGLAFHSLVGLGQVIHQGPLNLPGELALTTTQDRAAVINLTGLTWLRAYGLTFHPNVLGGFLCVGLILGLPSLNKRLMRLAWWLMILGLLLSFSRTAWLGALLILPPTILYLYWKTPALRCPLLWTIIPAAFTTIVGIIVFRDQIFTRLNPMQSLSEFTSISERGQLIIIALDNIRKNPLIGIGAGNFPLSMLTYNTLDPPHYVHNVPLLLASEVGILGGILWYCLWLIPTFKLDRLRKSNKNFPIVIIAAWFGWGSISLWDSYPWSLESGRILSILLLAWICKECTS